MQRRQALKQIALGMGIAFGAKELALFSRFSSAQADTWQTTAFTRSKLTYLQSMLDGLLPSSSTLGASDIALHRFVDFAFDQLLPADTKTIYLQQFSAYCDRHPLLIDKNQERRHKAIELLDKNAFENGAELSFYKAIKEYALLGYFSDEKVLKNQLNFQYVPGDFKACVKADENTKQFASINI